MALMNFSRETAAAALDHAMADNSWYTEAKTVFY
jgi:hypothetical protein